MAPSVLMVHLSHRERDGLRYLADQNGVSEEMTLRHLLVIKLGNIGYDVEKIKIKSKSKPKLEHMPRVSLWDEVKEYALAEVETHGYVSAIGLVRDLDISPSTAGKYIDLLIMRLDWTSEPPTRPRGNRGRPLKCAGPRVWSTLA